MNMDYTVTNIRAPRIEEFVQLLWKRVPHKTARHCVAATEFLATFAPALGLSNEQIALAGLLHDLCKAMTRAELLEAAHRYGLILTEAQRASAALLHGPVSAAECRHELGIDDHDVYDAIFWHTTGRSDWCRLGQALYLADFSEPHRAYPDAVQAREILKSQGFDKALLFTAERKLEHIQSRTIVDPATEQFLRWLRERDS